MKTETQLPTKTSNKIWTFEIFYDEPNGRWYVYADGKKSFECSDQESDEAPEIMKLYFDSWDTDDVTL